MSDYALRVLLTESGRALKRIAELEPEKDTEESDDEWGQAACYRLAVNIACGALGMPPEFGGAELDKPLEKC